MTEPTIGRKVYYFDPTTTSLTSHDRSKPFDVNIVYVWSSTCINIAGFDHNGNLFSRTSVPINETAGASAWCEWMPYQQGQAKAAT